MLKNIIILVVIIIGSYMVYTNLVVIIIGGYMVYTNYMQNEEIAALDGVVNEEHPGKINPDDLVSD